MLDIMLDLETFGVGIDPIIVQIGACYFDRITGEIGETFFMNVDAASGERAGLRFTSSTVYWWLQQSEAARLALLNSRVHIKLALEEFNSFVNQQAVIWSHATFDFVVLTSAYKRLNVVPNFAYNSTRDIRTLVDLAKIDVSSYAKVGVAHNALDDCRFQVQYCVAAINSLVAKDDDRLAV